jgi:hypothetical protein
MVVREEFEDGVVRRNVIGQSAARMEDVERGVVQANTEKWPIAARVDIRRGISIAVVLHNMKELV